MNFKYKNFYKSDKILFICEDMATQKYNSGWRPPRRTKPENLRIEIYIPIQLKNEKSNKKYEQRKRR